ncbi:hypothetical protein [Streptomyces gobiensis]|uniref:hypothetical protein n=1 Tax=Streptomyces gobiensis TaxID=2875706 RepID=UPI001E5610E0|nr:hypothetical protein [Streptomyces gobiensis]UGY94494.1 hypothetical protein test1122_24020 [Streptomyces gobiensis]
MSRILMHQPPPLLRRGWWCEFTARTPTADGGETIRSRAHEADTAVRALVWMRMSVRELVSGFDPEDNERAYRWLDHGQWEAAMRLKAGEAYTFVACLGPAGLEWTARPVLFLPLTPTASGLARHHDRGPVW